MMLRWTPNHLNIRLSQAEWKTFVDQRSVQVAFPLPFNLQHQVNLYLSPSPQIFWDQTGIQAHLPEDISFSFQAKNQPVWSFQFSSQLRIDVEVDLFSESKRSKRKET